MKLVIANKNYSTWSLRPWLLMTEKNLTFEEINESLNGDDLKSRLAQYSPSCKVPVLIDEELTVWDSLAICEYISEKFLNGEGWPRSVAARAHARSVSAEMHSSFVALRSEMPMNIRAKRNVNLSEAAQNDVRRIDDIWSECRQKFQKEGDWLFGAFSIADCMFTPVVLRFLTYEVDLSEQSRQYMATVLNNHSVKTWITAAKEETEIISSDEAGE
ncbi:MAG: glutathione S-transferase family protein [Deltaproteobacteria bacterium]|nr:glutathione S-transferase family protein [Deltaproteobacteria bacterium]